MTQGFVDSVTVDVTEQCVRSSSFSPDEFMKPCKE
jgi:hypothetical protein